MKNHHGTRTSGRVGTLPAVLALTAALLTTGCGDDDPSPTASPPATSGVPSAAGNGTAGDSSGPILPGNYQPLWPFTDAAAVAAWQQRHRDGGAESWRLDPGRTALEFTREFLGFKEVDEVVARKVDEREAWITVGYASPESSAPAEVAELHLLQVGGGDDRPWEVVGTEDDTMSLTTPKYGAAVRSPVTVGGRISGVDENIQVKVLQTGSSKPLGEFCCLPAGGDESPWSTKVTYKGGSGRTLTIVAWTGGHIADVERFALTGVRG